MFKFNGVLKENGLTGSQELVVVYPILYNSQLCKPNQLDCSVNAQAVLCECVKDYQLRIRGLPPVEAGGAFELLVEGVEQVSYRNPQSF